MRELALWRRLSQFCRSGFGEIPSVTGERPFSPGRHILVHCGLQVASVAVDVALQHGCRYPRPRQAASVVKELARGQRPPQLCCSADRRCAWRQGTRFTAAAAALASHGNVGLRLPSDDLLLESRSRTLRHGALQARLSSGSQLYDSRNRRSPSLRCKCQDASVVREFTLRQGPSQFCHSR